MREIIVTVDAKGNTVIETKGFSGGDCLKATMELEQALGAKTSDTKTREFHSSTKQTSTRTVGR